MRNISHKPFRENQNTRFLFDNIFGGENHAVYEIMWKNIVEPKRDDNMAQAHFTLIT